MLKLYKSIISALQFCTSLPLPVKTGMADLERGVAFFPVAGALIGLICGLVLHYTALVWNPHVGTVLTVTVYLILTRALHMDGFMDTIDGFFSGRSRECMLSIMKESTVGAFAVCGAICWFAWHMAFLPYIHWNQLILVYALARWGIIWMGLLSDYPRESGSGKFFVKNAKISQLAIGLLLSIGLGIWLGWLNLVLIPFILIYGWLVSIWARNKIGGATGDVLGFYIESGSMISILILSLINKIQ